MDTGSRSAASVLMWITYLVMVGVTIIPLGAWSILMAFVLMMPLLGAMGMMWSSGSGNKSRKRDYASADNLEKRKRDRLDAVLRDLSSDDLLRLKQRLSDNQIDDDSLYEMMVGDDGELLDQQ